MSLRGSEEDNEERHSVGDHLQNQLGQGHVDVEVKKDMMIIQNLELAVHLTRNL